MAAEDAFPHRSRTHDHNRSRVRHLGIQAAWITAKSCSLYCSSVEHCVTSEQATYSARLIGMVWNAVFEHLTTVTGEILMNYDSCQNDLSARQFPENTHVTTTLNNPQGSLLSAQPFPCQS